MKLVPSTVINNEQFLNWLIDQGNQAKNTLLHSNQHRLRKKRNNCSTRIWLKAEIVNNHISVEYSTESLLERGIVHVIATAMEQLTPEELETVSFADFQQFTSWLTYDQKDAAQTVFNAIIKQTA